MIIFANKVGLNVTLVGDDDKYLNDPDIAKEAEPPGS